MKKLVFVLLLVIAGQWASAQEGTYEVKGNVSNSSGEAIIGATITLQNDTTATTLVGAVTNAQGTYALRIPARGTYLLEVRCIGYKAQKQRVTIAQPTTQLDFTLEENGIELSEVEVVAKHTKLQSNGNIRVQFKGNPVTKGKSMSEALRFIPSVDVSGNQLLLNGKEDNFGQLQQRTFNFKNNDTITK